MHFIILYNTSIVATHKQRLAYVIDFINNHPLKKEGTTFLIDEPKDQNDLEHSSSSISYGLPDSDAAFWMPARAKYLSGGEMQNNNFNTFTTSNIDVFGLEDIKNEPRPFFENNAFNFDVFDTIFFMISRYEEYVAKERDKDKYGRMKSSAQLLVQSNLHQKPIVDQLVFAFFSVLGVEKSLKTSYTLTSDIDVLLKYPNFYRFTRNLGRALISYGSPLKFFQTIKQYIQVKLKIIDDPYDTFEWFLRQEKGFKKEIYFMAGGQTKEDNLYRIEEALPIIKTANEKGYIIGLHPSFDCVNNPELLKKEMNVLSKITKHNIQISRQHFLRFKFDTTISELENVGVKEDSTLGFQDEIGFRCGTGFPYYLYDFKQEHRSSILEKPLVIMDGSLVQCGGWGKEEIHKTLLIFLKDNAYNTHITFNFHNSSFDEVFLDGTSFKRLYLELVEYITK